ncbi:hypothetical protein ACF1BQ_036670 [Bradyrhizobium sp. RDT10]
MTQDAELALSVGSQGIPGGVIGSRQRDQFFAKVIIKLPILGMQTIETQTVEQEFRTLRIPLTSLTVDGGVAD